MAQVVKPLPSKVQSPVSPKKKKKKKDTKDTDKNKADNEVLLNFTSMSCPHSSSCTVFSALIFNCGVLTLQYYDFSLSLSLFQYFS
jgi:hypothetical protein